MIKKFVFLAGAGVGYLVGSKGGREKLMEIWKDPKVQETVSHGTEWAKEKAPGLQEKVAEVASTAKGKVSHSSDSDKPDSNKPGTGSSAAGSGGATTTPPSTGSFTTGGQHAQSPAEVQPETKQ